MIILYSGDNMNNKGFAISIVLYSIIFLIVTILYMLLGIVRNRYVINERLRSNIVDQLNREDYNCRWQLIDTYFGPNVCSEVSIPTNPIEGDTYTKKKPDKYNYTARYVCQGTTTNFTSEYIYISSNEANSACNYNVPECPSTVSKTCTTALYHNCETYEYTCL